MNLAEQLKREILNDGAFDGKVVTEYLTNFFKEQPDSTLTISFHNHYDWEKKGQPIDMNTASVRYGNKYGTSITLPSAWACDMVKFVRENGFCVWEDRSYNTHKLHNLRVSLV